MTDVLRQTYPFSLPDLPYPYGALEPHIDEATMRVHHDKHHKAYVDKLNDALAKQPELQKLQKDEEKKEQSEQRRAVKRLQKDMEKAAENLQKPQKKPGEKEDEQEQQQREQQASRNLKDAARETGRVDHDRRKQATQKKVASHPKAVAPAE